MILDVYTILMNESDHSKATLWLEPLAPARFTERLAPCWKFDLCLKLVLKHRIAD